MYEIKCHGVRIKNKIKSTDIMCIGSFDNRIYKRQWNRIGYVRRQRLQLQDKRMILSKEKVRVLVCGNSTA